LRLCFTIVDFVEVLFAGGGVVLVGVVAVLLQHDGFLKFGGGQGGGDIEGEDVGFG
jgi:hypothetical protein